MYGYQKIDYESQKSVECHTINSLLHDMHGVSKSYQLIKIFYRFVLKSRQALKLLNLLLLRPAVY